MARNGEQRVATKIRKFFAYCGKYKAANKGELAQNSDKEGGREIRGGGMVCAMVSLVDFSSSKLLVVSLMQAKRRIEM